ncbi:conserved hypothetical protein [Paraburkholderia piptadeniae]|uniref:Phage tail assembly protein n=1 Tax=Paraburkholderia piptadeniae TaxID=1701573 RepID=A0A1N7SSU6_9BURK|nr:phage tail assembly protein [Paraburkholderia piptadeniae]SIT50438.1 conserved hypothetical protein [Paraburkholderia piptadeniae]
MEDQKIITLDNPIKVGDIEVTSLTLREPTAGELERATLKDRPISVTLDLLAMVAGVPRSIVEKLPSRKLKEASQFISGFTEDGPSTGETQ